MYICTACVRLCTTPWTVAHQAPLFMGLSMQEYWSGLPFSPPGDLPNWGTEPALAGRFFNTEPPGKPYMHMRGQWPMKHCGLNLWREYPGKTLTIKERWRWSVSSSFDEDRQMQGSSVSRNRLEEEGRWEKEIEVKNAASSQTNTTEFKVPTQCCSCRINLLTEIVGHFLSR